MRHTKYLRWYRSPRTTQERRANQEGWERPRRRPHLLPNTYDDIQSTVTKSWKDKRKTQYREGKRGQRHTIVVSHWEVWDLREYFLDNDIPFELHDRWAWMRNVAVSWWSDKDIGIEYILQRIHKPV